MIEIFTKAERDPRIDPRRGDVISRDGFRIEVDNIEHNEVYFCRVKEDGQWQGGRMDLSTWREQAENSIVERRAD